MRSRWKNLVRLDVGVYTCRADSAKAEFYSYRKPERTIRVSLNEDMFEGINKILPSSFSVTFQNGRSCDAGCPLS